MVTIFLSRRNSTATTARGDVQLSQMSQSRYPSYQSGRSYGGPDVYIHTLICCTPGRSVTSKYCNTYHGTNEVSKYRPTDRESTTTSQASSNDQQHEALLTIRACGRVIYQCVRSADREKYYPQTQPDRVYMHVHRYHWLNGKLDDDRGCDV